MISGISVLFKVVYFFLIGLISVLLAVICAFIVIVVIKPTNTSLAKIRTGIRNNKILNRNIPDKEQSLIMKNKGKMEFIEDM